MTQPYTIVAPTLITDDNFVSSTIPEDDEPVYNPATTYALGDRVIRTTGVHKIYESLQNSNTGNTPETSPTFWVEVGPTNRWAAFDDSGGTISTGTSPVEFVLTGDRIDTIAFLDLDAVTVRVEAFNVDEGTYFDETFTLPDASVITNWYEYFFSPINRKRSLIVRNIPPVSASTYTITIESGGTVSLGTFVMGMSTQLGFTQYGATVGIQNYGRSRTDEFGRRVFVRRNFSRRMDAQIFIDRGVTDSIRQYLEEFRDRPALFIGAGDAYDSLNVYGFYLDFNIVFTYPNHNFCNLQVESIA